MTFISAFEDNVHTGAIMTVDTSQVYDICYLVSSTSMGAKAGSRLCVWRYSVRLALTFSWHNILCSNYA